MENTPFEPQFELLEFGSLSGQMSQIKMHIVYRSVALRDQLLQVEEEVTSMSRLGYPLYFLTLLVIWKILGVIAVLIPKFPLLKECACAGFFFAMSGAAYSHIVMADPINETLPSLLLLALTVVSWYFRPTERKLVAWICIFDKQQTINMDSKNKTLSDEHRMALLAELKARFDKNKHRHDGLDWTKIQAKLEANPQKLWSLDAMEETGGEPDVIGYDQKTDAYLFVDCAAESPKGRRSICYDHEALESRKEHKPKDSAIGMAENMGVFILNEEEYRHLQTLENFDLKTSSWIQTPVEVRKLGGALFCDRRYNQVFLYHNGAESYYAARGFRALLRV